MNKLPTYLGIFAIDPKSASKQLRAYSRSCLQQIVSQIDSVEIQQDYAKFQQNFTAPKDNYHITTLYIGGNAKCLKTKKQNQLLKCHKPDTKVDIKIVFCVYVPGVLMVGYSPDTAIVDCDNTYPHVTLFLGHGISAVESNAVLQLIFTQNPNITKQQFDIKEMNEKYKNKPIYVIRKQVLIGGVTGDNFKNGNKK